MISLYCFILIFLVLCLYLNKSLKLSWTSESLPLKQKKKILDSVCHTEAQESEMSILFIDLFNKHLLSIYCMYMTKHWSVKMKLAWPLMLRNTKVKSLTINHSASFIHSLIYSINFNWVSDMSSSYLGTRDIIITSLNKHCPHEAWWNHPYS